MSIHLAMVAQSLKVNTFVPFFLNIHFHRLSQTHRTNVMSEVLNATMNGLFGLVVVLIACEIGQRISDTFDQISFTIDQYAWYLFPIQIKRTLPMIMENSQESVSIACFGSIACTREVFKNVGIKKLTIKLRFFL